MARPSSERRNQRKHFLKQMKSRLSPVEFQELKKEFREEGKKLRVEDLRESLEAEKEILAHKEGDMRESLKKEGFKKKEIDLRIDEWMANTKIWALHSDVYDALI
jgi:DNA polymerase III delta prime subunit